MSKLKKNIIITALLSTLCYSQTFANEQRHVDMLLYDNEISLLSIVNNDNSSINKNNAVEAVFLNKLQPYIQQYLFNKILPMPVFATLLNLCCLCAFYLTVQNIKQGALISSPLSAADKDKEDENPNKQEDSNSKDIKANKEASIKNITPKEKEDSNSKDIKANNPKKRAQDSEYVKAFKEINKNIDAKEIKRLMGMSYAELQIITKQDVAAEARASIATLKKELKLDSSASYENFANKTSRDLLESIDELVRQKELEVKFSKDINNIFKQAGEEVAKQVSDECGECKSLIEQAYKITGKLLAKDNSEKWYASFFLAEHKIPREMEREIENLYTQVSTQLKLTNTIPVVKNAITILAQEIEAIHKDMDDVTLKTLRRAKYKPHSKLTDLEQLIFRQAEHKLRESSSHISHRIMKDCEHHLIRMMLDWDNKFCPTQKEAEDLLTRGLAYKDFRLDVYEATPPYVHNDKEHTISLIKQVARELSMGFGLYEYKSLKGLTQEELVQLAKECLDSGDLLANVIQNASAVKEKINIDKIQSLYSKVFEHFIKDNDSLVMKKTLVIIDQELVSLQKTIEDVVLELITKSTNHTYDNLSYTEKSIIDKAEELTFKSSLDIAQKIQAKIESKFTQTVASFDSSSKPTKKEEKKLYTLKSNLISYISNAVQSEAEALLLSAERALTIKAEGFEYRVSEITKTADRMITNVRNYISTHSKQGKKA